MREDRRRRYDDGFRREALELIKSGAGKDTLARRLAIPVYTARNWIGLYRSNGEEAVMGGGGSRRYDWETKVAAARDHVENGLTKTEAMARHGIASIAYLKAKVAYLENSGPCGRPSHAARAKRRRPTARRAGTPARPPPEDSRAAEIHVLPPPVAPGARVQAGRGADGTGDMGAHPERVRPPAGAHVPGPRVRHAHIRQDRAQGHAPYGLRCAIRSRNPWRRYSSYRGETGDRVHNLPERDFDAARPFSRLGTDVTEFKVAGSKAYLAPVYDMASKEIVAWDVSRSPDLGQQRRLPAMLAERLPAGTEPILHSDMGWQYQHQWWRKELERPGIRRSMSRKGNCLDNAAAEQVFGHLKDEFYRGRVFDSYEQFKRELDAYIIHWNTRRRQIRLEGRTPEEFRSMSLAV